MSRRTNNPDVDLCCYARCPQPGRVILDRRLSVWISNGLMHRDCHAEQTRRVAEILAPFPDAVPYTTLCEGCRQWVDGIFHVGPQDGKRFCILCSAKAGDSTAIMTLTRQGRWDPTARKPIAAPPPPPPAPPPSPPAEPPRPASRNFSNLMSLLDDL